MFSRSGTCHAMKLDPEVPLDDLLSLLAEEMTELAKLVSHERQREATART